MLSVRRCRELVGKDCPLNDEELEILRNQFYALARITVSEFENRTNSRVRRDNTERPVNEAEFPAVPNDPDCRGAVN